VETLGISLMSCPQQLWDSLTILSNDHRGISRGIVNRNVNITTHIKITPELRTSFELITGSHIVLSLEPAITFILPYNRVWVTTTSYILVGIDASDDHTKSLTFKNRVFVVGSAGPTTNTARLSPRYEGKSRGCHCSH
jgi:hypothetical protein